MFLSDRDIGNVFKVDRRGRLTRFAGNGSGLGTSLTYGEIQRFSGDGGPATSAELNEPSGLAVDRFGNLFISDKNNNRVRRVDSKTGIITTVAGSGVRGFGGDSGPATNAELNRPESVAVDAAGGLLIADTGNHRVRRVDVRTGVIATIAGNGNALGNSGLILGSMSGDGGPATSAELGGPTSVVLDNSGNLFVADLVDYRIRRVDSKTGIITTVAGTGEPGFSGDGGPATRAKLAGPTSVSIDSFGNLFVVEAGSCRVRRIDARTRIITRVAGNSIERDDSGDGGPAARAD